MGSQLEWIREQLKSNVELTRETDLMLLWGESVTANNPNDRAAAELHNGLKRDRELLREQYEKLKKIEAGLTSRN